ncbi:MAG: MFS transporter [Alphaproteobacteria bacterium 32-64-14]|nr:MAG: MFS transporter [Alphaproteobacteria bacterium 32-64-14]
METASPKGAAAPEKQNGALVIGASSVGTMFEWYDFFLYGSLVANINMHFYTGVNETTGYILALATFAAGFIVRPFGALAFGRIGDIVGRKNTFLVTMIIMGIATFLVGLLPGAAWFEGNLGAGMGIIAPILLVALRVLQGLAIGGEYGGAATYIAEHAPADRRGFFTSWIQITATIGLFISLLVILGVRQTMSPEDFNEWGWRIPFLLSAGLLVVSVWIRVQLNESPVFLKMKEEAATSKAPLKEAFGKWKNVKWVLVALFGCVMGQAVIWYTGTFYGLTYMKQTLRMDPAQADTLVAVSLLIGTPFYIFFGWLSDKIGRRYLILAGLLIPVFTYFPLFNMLTHSANPGLAAAIDTSPVVVRADPAACALQFDPVGKNKFDTQSCDVAKALLAKAGVSYNATELPAGSPAEIQIGGQSYPAPAVETMAPADRAPAIAAYNAEVSEALKAAGYPANADKNLVNAAMVVALLFFTQLCTAMVYGPMAAMLVELFPAKVRYTSMSLPYHIGNGWFGGLLPTIAFAIVASTGNIYAGIWYPTIIAGITFVVALFFLPETYKRDITHDKSGPVNPGS